MPECGDHPRIVRLLKHTQPVGDAAAPQPRPSQVRLDTAVQGIEGTYIHAVYYPGENQIQTVMQQGELFAKQEQLFSVVATGAASLLTVDMDVQVTMPVPEPMVKMLLNNVLEHLAENLKQRAEQLAAS